MATEHKQEDRYRWYRDPTTIWALGRVVPRDEYGDDVPPRGSVLLELNKGAGPRQVFTEAETFIHNHTHTEEGLEDVANMDDMHEAPLLDLLRRRYAANEIYTFTSEMVVSVNPYKPVEGMYDIDGFRARLPELAVPPPHLFTVAHRAHESLLKGENQSILMSGESGAGKTEASKYVLRYLVTSSASQRGGGTDVGAHVEECLIKSIPLLETFGNALTVNNDNSSRFGKFMKLQYAEDGSIAGGCQETFLLEKSRLVSQDHQEANFHIFYHLLAGASPEEREALHLGGEFEYLIHGTDIAGTGDLDTLAEVKSEMASMGFSDDDVAHALRTVAGVLNLGNIAFVGKEEDENLARVDPASEAAMGAVADLLGLSPGLLATALTSRTFSIDAGRQASETRVPLTRKQAADSRNALAKEVYARLFNWVVSKVNQTTEHVATAAAGGAGGGAGAGGATSASAGNRYVGILDIFGFEVEEENGFPQLCINYANEMLQSLFNTHVFVLEQQEYDAEGITWNTMSFQDNKEVLQLMHGKPSGLFVALDEQAMLGDRASDDAWLSVCMNAHLNKCERFGRPKVSPEDKFTVTHYASAVTYRAAGFVDRNNDSLEHDLSNLARASQHDFVADLFGGRPSLPPPPGGEDVDDTTATPRSRKKFAGSVTVSRQFRQQMSALMQELDVTRPQFIRCVKPNNEKAPNSLDPHLCLHQLKYLGVFETVRIRQSGYPVRRKFASMAAQIIQLYRGSIAKAREMLAERPRELCEELVTTALGPVPEGDPAPAWQMGKTKVFLRQGKLEDLDKAVQARLTANAVMIQKIIKGRRARQEYKQKLSRLMLLQIWIVMMRVRRRKRKAAIKIETAGRRYVARRDFVKQKTGATRLQAVTRQRRQRAQYRREQAAALALHRVARGFMARDKTHRYLGAIIKLQASQRRKRFRGRHVNVLRSRKKWRDILHSGEAVLLQSLVRKQRAKAGMFKVDRQRQLILTTQPRIIYLDPTVKNVKAAIKGVIPFDSNLAVEKTDEHTFVLHHSSEDGHLREMTLTDLLGSAERWVVAITQAQTKPTSVKDLYYGQLPEEFEMQGQLWKKKRTKSGWNNKFFVVRQDTIAWFSSAHATSAKDAFRMDATTSLEDHQLKPFGFALKNGDGSQLVLAATTAEDEEAWRLCLRQLLNRLKLKAGPRGGRASVAGAGAGAGAGSA